MPGLKRSPGMADIEPSVDGYSALEKAFRDSWTPKDDARIPPRLSLGQTHLNDLSPSIPAAWPESPTSDGSSSEILVHEGFENLAMLPPRMQQARALDLDDRGLPPTPPTMDNSDGADTLRDNRPSPPPIFADDLRNALESKTSVTPVNAVSPPTPDPSPPAHLEDQPMAMRNEQSHFLHPMVAESRSLHGLKHYASSRAESFRTAREDQPLSPDPTRSQVRLAEDDTLPEHWLDNTRDLQLADLGMNDTMVAKTLKADDAIPLTTVSSRSSRRKSKHESPPHTMEGDGTDWEKHISYVGPEELGEYPEVKGDVIQPDVQPAAESLPRGLGLSGHDFNHDSERSVEDVNNMVYKQIQKENVKRHSTISTNSAAIPVGLVFPPSESTPRTLKRQTKCSSLRGDNGSETPRGSFDADIPPLSYKKIRRPERQKKLDDSPVFESSIRQVSSPARLSIGPDASNMTALTFASLQDSPSGRHVAKFQPMERKHTLRHTSHGDRLLNNPDVRRTSLHGSPGSTNRWVDKLHEAGAPVVTPPRTPPRRSLTLDRVGHNVGVKRNSMEGARPSRVLEKSAIPIRGVIPSVASEPEEWSPPSSKLRRFSREERLENNGDVRRTSMGSARDIVEPQLEHHSPPSSKLRRFSREERLENSNSIRHASPPDLNKDLPDILPLPYTLGSSSEKSSYFPTSPRKSLDARFLHPTTTPMSTSNWSDRTVDVEVCEASGVRIYPHNNESLLLVQHGSRPASKDKSTPDSSLAPAEYHPRLGTPVFAAQVDPPTPEIGTTDPDAEADSPLTNPRAAPEPPIIKFIPPTPNSELDRQLSSQPPSQTGTSNLRANVALPTRRLSLLQKARRYSDSLFVRSTSFRSTRSYNPPEERSRYLSPLWRPQGFWDEYDSEDDEYYDDFEASGRLPKGGDTSDVPDEAGEGKRGLLVLPRAMSKRLPGFRGKGGFLVGNSLGIERHGTNSRRHYVGTVERSLSKSESAEYLGRTHDDAPMAGGDEEVKGRSLFVVPFSGGRRAQWVGVRSLSDRMAERRAKRERREAERRRERLKGLIGGRVYEGS